MTCEEALVLISGRIDGMNTPEEEQQLNIHLASCPDCRKILEEFAQADRDLRSLNAEVPADLRSSVIEQIGKHAKRKNLRPVWRSLTAAALALVVGLGFWRTPHEAEPATMSRSMDVSVASAFPFDASFLAEERQADVVVITGQLPEELSDCQVEILPDGTLLYTFPHGDTADNLSKAYDFILYRPENGADSDISYGWLVS